MGGNGSGGKNRQPSALQKLRGNPGKRKKNNREPKPKLGEPEMPQHLGKIGRAAWRRLVPILLAMKVLSVADGDALGAYCCAIEQLVMAQQAIAKFGMLIAEVDMAGISGVLKINPAVRIKSDALRQMRSFESEFGLTPASRSRLQINVDSDDADPFEDFLSGKGEDNSARKPN